MSIDIKNLPATYWLTRDRKHGVLSDQIEVWRVLPERIRCEDGDVMWFAPLDIIDREVTSLGFISIGEAHRLVGSGYPETDRECLHVGDEPVTAVTVS